MICRRQKENRRFDRRQKKYRRLRLERRQIEDEDLIKDRQKIVKNRRFDRSYIENSRRQKI